MKNSPIRILHILGKRPVGGVGSFLFNMHSNVDRSKIQFDYLMNSSEPDGDFDKKVKSLGGKVYILPELCYKNTFKYLIDLNNFYKKSRHYRTIHVHSLNIGMFNFLLAKKYGIKNRIAHSHSVKYSDNLINSIRNFLLELPIKRLSNVYFACSKQAGVFLFGKKLIKENKVYIAKNAIEALRFKYNLEIRKNVRNSLGIDKNFVIGHVGAFLPVKNHSYIVDIFNEVHKKNNKSVLLLIGTGELENKIKNKVKMLNLENSVIFLGNRNDVNELMQALDFFVLPSFFEGLPLVGIEAQAAGLPCIFSDTITRELKITENVIFNNIKKPPYEWAIEILKYNNFRRKDTYLNIVDAGYDVKSTARNLENCYIKLNKYL